jgi:hypothetical protein
MDWPEGFDRGRAPLPRDTRRAPWLSLQAGRQPYRVICGQHPVSPSALWRHRARHDVHFDVLVVGHAREKHVVLSWSS